MKHNISEFIHRGLVACGFGPLVLAVFYLVLHHQGAVEMLSVREVCLGIFSLSGLAFVAGGMNILYQIERLPLMLAVLIHGSVLYTCYLVTYLINDWLESGMIPILVFSVIFVVTYLSIWAVIFITTKKKTRQVNEYLKQKQQETGSSRI